MKQDRDAGDDASACSSRYQRSRHRRSVPVLLPQTASPDLQAATCQLQSGPDSATCLPRSAPPAAVGTDSRYEPRWKPAAAGMSSNTLLWQAHLKARSFSTRPIIHWCEAPCALVSPNHSQAKTLSLLIWTYSRGRLQQVRRDESQVECMHGMQIADPYRWLEDPDAPETEACKLSKSCSVDYLEKFAKKNGYYLVVQAPCRSASSQVRSV